MREYYFDMYTRFVYNKFYYSDYRAAASLFNFIICFIISAASAYGIAEWLIWKQWPWLWAIIIGISQIANIFRERLPLNKRIYAVNYFVLEVDCLIDDVASNWRKINSESSTISDKEIQKLIKKYEKEFTAILHKYIKDEIFPDSNLIAKKAEISRDKYFSSKYGTPTTKKLIEMEVKDNATTSESAPNARQIANSR